MKRTTHRYLNGLGALVILGIALIIGGSRLPHSDTGNAGKTATQAPAGTMALTIEPEAGIAPALKLIQSAKHSIDLTMYELEDSRIEQALEQAESRGVQVRVLLNEGYYGQPDRVNPNQTAFDYLQAHGVPVRWTPKYFALTHQKTLVVDDTTSLIMTYNFTPQYYATSRDFGITDTDSKDIGAIESTFNADWQAQKITAPSGDDLLWSPGSETAMIELINQANASLKIYNEEMADGKIVSALDAAAKRGVNVQVVMTDSSEWHANFRKLTGAGVQVRVYAASAPLYIHAKMILVDNRTAFLGSENFSIGSLNDNRELGIILTNAAIIKQLHATFSADFAGATTY
jgi:phosphatidylserine/phosphatidylglycerophosphate/cardiolipin synthase-like enzyme